MHQAVKGAWRACMHGVKVFFFGLLMIAMFIAMILPHVQFLIRLPGMSWEDSQVAMLLFTAVMAAMGALMGGETYPPTEAAQTEQPTQK